ncbi:AraC family transcriptional regulator [Noviherbaspirillum denitrificans]|uniref:AraC family transcriptional regulator n=2 Tax=Noviherbaspirillum denitrificans TaxID=1968433 RepID=A0A254TSW0_9BURK|nr:AraC family transcriptional regulator [Noviherbaspirillum denitrificans]
MLAFVQTRHGMDAACAVLAEAGIPLPLLARPEARITRPQFVALYKSVAAILDDEMLGLWSRPIRSGTLKYLMLSLLDAPTIQTALYRFVRFWNLLLDDYRLQMSRRNEWVRIALVKRRPDAPARLLGHELMMKLVHGVSSWLLGRDIHILRIELAFPRPAHADDYVFLYPAEVCFDSNESSIYLAEQDCASSFNRERHQLWSFLKRAPEDWTFSSFHRGSMSARARAFLEPRLDQAVTIRHVAEALHLSVRTLNRKFAEEETHFQQIKDALRRDIAIHRLTHSDVPVTNLALDLGFSNPAAFCRAFKEWTGSTPTAYRKGSRSA